MPRRIRDDISFDDAENEILFTRAGMKADPDAQEFVAMTDGWMHLVDGARAKDRTAREKVMDTAAPLVAVGLPDSRPQAPGDYQRSHYPWPSGICHGQLAALVFWARTVRCGRSGRSPLRP